MKHLKTSLITCLTALCFWANLAKGVMQPQVYVPVMPVHYLCGFDLNTRTLTSVPAPGCEAFLAPSSLHISSPAALEAIRHYIFITGSNYFALLPQNIEAVINLEQRYQSMAYSNAQASERVQPVSVAVATPKSQSSEQTRELREASSSQNNPQKQEQGLGILLAAANHIHKEEATGS